MHKNQVANTAFLEKSLKEAKNITSIGILVIKNSNTPIPPQFIDIAAHERFVENIFSIGPQV